MRHGAPAHLAVERDRRALEPQPVVLANRLHAASEVDALGAGGRREQLGERRRERLALVEGAQEVRVGGGMDAAQQRQDLVADQAANGVAVRRVVAERRVALFAVAAGVVAPDAEKRADDAVLALRLDAFRGAARDEAVEDRLDLVRERMAGRAETIGREAVADPAKLVLGRRRRGRRRPLRRDALGRSARPASDSPPRRRWFTCSAETRVAELA